jgi:hypothetical protein
MGGERWTVGSCCVGCVTKVLLLFRYSSASASRGGGEEDSMGSGRYIVCGRGDGGVSYVLFGGR